MAKRAFCMAEWLKLETEQLGPVPRFTTSSGYKEEYTHLIKRLLVLFPAFSTQTPMSGI